MSLTPEQRLQVIADTNFDLGTIIKGAAKLDPEHAADMLSTAILATIRPLTQSELVEMRDAIVPCGKEDCSCHISGKSAIEAALLLKPFSDGLIDIQITAFK